MNPFEVYQAYFALKAHFNSSYDFQKYQGKIKNATVQSFEGRNDKYIFHKLAKHKDPFGFLLANITTDLSYFPLDCKVHNTDKRYADWLKRTQSLTYIFTEDLKKLNSDFNSNFKIVDNKIPLLMFYLRGELSLETIAILVDLTDAGEYWLRWLRKEDTNIFLDVVKKILKYLPFLNYDKGKFRNIVKEKWHEKSYDSRSKCL